MKDIEYVLTIARCRSISKAAEKLYLSQPSLSRYINKLEQELGVQLFRRTSSGIELTDAGEIYVDYGNQIRALYNTMETKLRGLHTDNANAIRIGMTLNASYMSSGRMNKMMKAKFPDCELTISNIRSVDMVNALHNGELDFVIGPSLREQNDTIAVERLTAEYFLLMVPDRWNLQKYAQTRPGLPYPWIDLRDIRSSVDFIIPNKTSAVRQDLEDVLKAYDITLDNSNMITINSTLAIQAAQAQLGCYFVTETFYPYGLSAGHLSLYSVGDPPKISCSNLMWLKDAHLSREKQYCMSILRQVVTDDFHRIIEIIRNTF